MQKHKALTTLCCEKHQHEDVLKKCSNQKNFYYSNSRLKKSKDIYRKSSDDSILSAIRSSKITQTCASLGLSHNDSFRHLSSSSFADAPNSAEQNNNIDVPFKKKVKTKKKKTETTTT